MSLGLLGGLGMTAEAAAAPREAAGQTVTVLADGRLRVKVDDGSGATGTVVIGLRNGEFTDVAVGAVVDGRGSRDVFEVDTFTLTGGENFTAELRSTTSRRVMSVDSQAVTQQAFPVLLVLGLVARLGIRWVIRWYGKTQIKKAAKSYLLNNVNANGWRHIMAPKHRWGSVGARSKDQVAELMGRAMAEGGHSAYGTGETARKAEWAYRGKTVVVTYNKDSGAIGNGWVAR